MTADPISRPLTDAELAEIEQRNDTLYSLWNACGKAGLYWHTQHKLVHDLMQYLNDNFPANDVRLLYAEVKRLKAEVRRLKAANSTAIKQVMGDEQ